MMFFTHFCVLAIHIAYDHKFKLLTSIPVIHVIPVIHDGITGGKRLSVAAMTCHEPYWEVSCGVCNCHSLGLLDSSPARLTFLYSYPNPPQTCPQGEPSASMKFETKRTCHRKEEITLTRTFFLSIGLMTSPTCEPCSWRSWSSSLRRRTLAFRSFLCASRRRTFCCFSDRVSCTQE